MDKIKLLLNDPLAFWRENNNIDSVLPFIEVPCSKGSKMWEFKGAAKCYLVKKGVMNKIRLKNTGVERELYVFVSCKRLKRNFVGDSELNLPYKTTCSLIFHFSKIGW
jgi:hypothetical protein